MSVCPVAGWSGYRLTDRLICPLGQIADSTAPGPAHIAPRAGVNEADNAAKNCLALGRETLHRALKVASRSDAGT